MSKEIIVLEKSYKILIVDDNYKNIQLLGSVLKSENYNVEFATNGLQALEWIYEDNFDLIILDVMMPEMSGYQVADILSKNEKYNKIPIIFLTAMNDSKSIVDGFNLGAQDYVSKPFNIDELLARIKNQLAIKKANELIINYSAKLEESLFVVNESINYAKIIQKALYPKKEKIGKIFEEYFVLNIPKDTISGDFYWIKKINNKVFFAVADCTGHGVPGAMMSMLGMSLLNEVVVANHTLNANEILNILRDKIKEALSQSIDNVTALDGMDISFCILNLENNILQYAGAYNSLLFVRNNKLLSVKADKQPIGIHIKEWSFTNNIVQLQKGDIIYLSTDGYYDQFGGANTQKFLKRNFEELLTTVSKHNLSEQYCLLLRNFQQWKGQNEQTDDVMIIGIKI